MDNQRLLLWAALAIAIWLNVEAWMRDYQPVVAPATTSVTAPPTTGTAAAGSVLGQSVPSVAATPTAAAVPAAGAPAAVDASLPAATAVAATVAEQKIHVVTDVLDLEISTVGGVIDRADILKYPREKNTPNIPLRLFNTDSPDSMFVFQSGLTTDGPTTAPNHTSLYSAASTDYRLVAGQDELRVPLTWSNEHGVKVMKTFVLKRGSYAMQIVYDVQNTGTAPWRAASYAQFLRHLQPTARSMWDPSTYAFAGPAIYDGTKYRKLDVEKEDDQKYTQPVTGGWLAAMQHHFVAAIVPPVKVQQDFTLHTQDRQYLLRAVGPATEVAPGAALQFVETLFVGPKLQDQLREIGPKLERTADYGKLTIIAEPLFWLLEKVHGIVGNWGWAIIIVTLLIKLAFYKLAATSGRSMAKMRSVAPRIKAIQERYKDDREQLGKQMMELYKREKINPLAGCLPILVQIPVFMGFYWVLLESVEMRQAPFMMWINDLSARDPFFILPAIMGVAMFGQYKLNPAPPDPMQAKIFAFMPLVMTVMMAFFPAGLVLYWITNTGLSILQQWRINKVVAEEEKKSKS